jgi:hypothetical protein
MLAYGRLLPPGSATATIGAAAIPASTTPFFSMLEVIPDICFNSSSGSRAIEGIAPGTGSRPACRYYALEKGGHIEA